MSETQLSIIPFGGVRENGKNMFAVTVDDEIFILDAGLKYPETDLLGVDVVVPDFSYLIANIDKVAGIFLTHGHADSIGALPYFLQQAKVPIFGSPLTIELAKLAIKSVDELSDFDDFHVVNAESKVDFGKTSISFFSTTHSIPQSLGIVVETQYGQVVYTGDFKFDPTAKLEYQTDFGRLTDIARKGVVALMADVNGVETPGQSVSESVIDEYIFNLFRHYKQKRIVVALVASNVIRIQQIINAAFENGRKVALAGNDLENIVKTAIEMGKIILPAEENKIFTDVKNVKSLNPNEAVILVAGKMGEPIRHLQKMASGQDRDVQIADTDLVFIATTPSISAESIMARTRDLLYRRGADVKAIKDDLRSSGHASQADLQLLMNILKPKFFFPTQGEYRVMTAADYLAQEIGIKKDQIFLMMRGDQYKYVDDQFVLSESFKVTETMIDGAGFNDVGDVVLRDRRLLANDGVFVLVIAIDRKKKTIVTEPKITSRGFVFTDPDLIKKASEVATVQIKEYLNKAKDFDWNDLKNGVRDEVSKFISDQTRRRPAVMPVIMEVNQNRRPSAKKKPETNSGKQANNPKPNNEPRPKPAPKKDAENG